MTNKANTSCIAAFFIIALCCGRSPDTKNENQPDWLSMPESELLDYTQRETFKYFWDLAEPNSRMALERYHPEGIYPLNDKHIVTTGGSGFGTMAILVGIERGFITRDEGIERLHRIVGFLKTADRFHGVWPHWLNGETGKVKPFNRKDDGVDLVETSFLIQGLLCVRQY
tara:strand:+ start:70 stop:579 length:510 start_codon:yes stop_codon:yes gene_type:complete